MSTTFRERELPFVRRAVLSVFNNVLAELQLVVDRECYGRLCRNNLWFLTIEHLITPSADIESKYDVVCSSLVVRKRAEQCICLYRFPHPSLHLSLLHHLLIHFVSDLIDHKGDDRPYPVTSVSPKGQAALQECDEI